MRVSFLKIYLSLQCCYAIFHMFEYCSIQEVYRRVAIIECNFYIRYYGTKKFLELFQFIYRTRPKKEHVIKESKEFFRAHMEASACLLVKFQKIDVGKIGSKALTHGSSEYLKKEFIAEGEVIIFKCYLKQFQ